MFCKLHVKPQPFEKGELCIILPRSPPPFKCFHTFQTREITKKKQFDISRKGIANTAKWVCILTCHVFSLYCGEFMTKLQSLIRLPSAGPADPPPAVRDAEQGPQRKEPGKLNCSMNKWVNLWKKWMSVFGNSFYGRNAGWWYSYPSEKY